MNKSKKHLLVFLLITSIIATAIPLQLTYNSEKPANSFLYNTVPVLSNFSWLSLFLLGIALLNLTIIILASLLLNKKEKTGTVARKPTHAEYESEWRAMAKQIAHEIKNPLTPLKLGVQLLEKSWRDKDPNFDKKFEKFSKSFIEQIDNLSLIASEFSNFAKMPDMPLESVDLKEIVHQVINVYENLPELSIIFKDKTEVPIYVKANTEQLFRVFNGLIKNSIEAIPDYRKGIVEIILEKTNGQVQIQIKDNGRGIHPDLQQEIFRPNFTTKSSGTGLGLAFVKQAVENMMGKVYFETKQNSETSFYIVIPLAS